MDHKILCGYGKDYFMVIPSLVLEAVSQFVIPAKPHEIGCEKLRLSSTYNAYPIHLSINTPDPISWLDIDRVHQKTKCLHNQHGSFRNGLPLLG